MISVETLSEYTQWIEERVLTAFADRILPVDTAVARRCARLHVPDPKPYRDSLIAATAFPRTAERLAARGYTLRLVDADELAKAEGAVTCCSLIVTEPVP